MIEDEEVTDSSKISQPFAFGTQAQAALDEWSREDERNAKLSSLSKKFSFKHEDPKTKVVMAGSKTIQSLKRKSRNSAKESTSKKKRNINHSKAKANTRKRARKGRKIGSISSRMSKKYNRHFAEPPTDISMLSGKKGKLRSPRKDLKDNAEEEESKDNLPLYTKEEWNDALTQVKKRFSMTNDLRHKESLDSLTQKYNEKCADINNTTNFTTSTKETASGEVGSSDQKEYGKLWPRSSGAPGSLNREDIKMLYDYDSDGNSKSFLSEDQVDDVQWSLNIKPQTDIHDIEMDGSVITLSQVMKSISMPDSKPKLQSIDNDDLITIDDSCSDAEATPINLDNIESVVKNARNKEISVVKVDEDPGNTTVTSIATIGTQEHPLPLSSSPVLSHTASKVDNSIEFENHVEDNKKGPEIRAKLVRKKLSANDLPNNGLLRRSSTGMSVASEIKKLKSINQLPESIDTVSEIQNSFSTENSDDLICVGYNDSNIHNTPLSKFSERESDNGDNYDDNNDDDIVDPAQVIGLSCSQDTQFDVAKEADVSTNVVQVISSQKEPAIEDDDVEVNPPKNNKDHGEFSSTVFTSAQEQFEKAQNKFSQQVPADETVKLKSKDCQSAVDLAEIPDSQYETPEIKQRITIFETFTTKQLRTQITEWGLKPARSRSGMLSLIQMACGLMDQSILQKAVANFDPSKSEILRLTQAEKMPELQSVKEKELIKRNIFNKIRDCLVEGNEMYQKILMYKPLDINQVMKYLHGYGLKDLDTDVVCDCLDELGVCFSAANERKLQRKSKSK